MRIVTAPARLRIAVSLLFLSVPLVALEVLFVRRSPWWDLPKSLLWLWCSIAFFWSALSAVSLLRGRLWFFRVLTGVAGIWFVVSGFFSLRYRYPAIGFFTVALWAGFGGLLVWIRRELDRSYLNPEMKWYQGLPDPIPGLSCEVGEDPPESYRVSRLDKEGLFVFRDSPARRGGGLGLLPPQRKTNLVLSFRNRQLRCQGVPMALLERTEGAGFQFQRMPADMRKEVGDFVEMLRGEGYVHES